MCNSKLGSLSTSHNTLERSSCFSPTCCSTDLISTLVPHSPWFYSLFLMQHTNLIIQRTASLDLRSVSVSFPSPYISKIFHQPTSSKSCVTIINTRFSLMLYVVHL
jgi:hypothetical protein